MCPIFSRYNLDTQQPSSVLHFCPTNTRGRAQSNPSKSQDGTELKSSIRGNYGERELSAKKRRETDSGMQKTGDLLSCCIRRKIRRHRPGLVEKEMLWNSTVAIQGAGSDEAGESKKGRKRYVALGQHSLRPEVKKVNKLKGDVFNLGLYSGGSWAREPTSF